MSDALPYIAIAFSGLTLLVLVAEKLFGGGNALANKFHALATETTLQIAAVRADLNAKVDGYEDSAGVGFETIRNNIHAMQIGLLEFRAKMAEDLHAYIRKDDYNAGVSDVKREMQSGFTRVDDRLGELQDLIMYANPDVASRMQHRPKSG
jgi:hypothetical protein